MQPRPFKLLNGSERHAIAARADGAVRDWLRAWTDGPAPAGAAACRPAAEAGPAAADTGWLGLGGEAGVLYCADPRQARATLSALLSGTGERVPANGTLAAAAIDAALADLAARFVGGPAVADATVPDAMSFEPGSGAALVTLPVGGATLTLLADPALVRALVAPLAPPPRRLPALTPPQHCLGREPVGIRVWLGDAELDLAQFQTLAPGDVILLDSRIDQPLRVSVAGRDVAPRAYLGQADQTKAVRLAVPGTHH